MIGAIASHYVASGGEGYDAAVLADSPLVYYRLGETAGTVMADSSGNLRDGTYYNTPTLGAAGPILSDPVNNLAVTLNGTDEYADVAHGTWANVTACTLEAWVKTTDTDGIVVGTMETNGYPHCLRVHSTLGLYFEIRNTSGTGFYANDGSSTVRDGNWHHIVGTYAPGTVKTYRDGVNTATNTSGTPSGNLQSVTAARSIGRRGNGVYLAGTVARIAIYGTALSAERVLAHYNAGIGA